MKTANNDTGMIEFNKAVEAGAKKHEALAAKLLIPLQTGTVFSFVLDHASIWTQEEMRFVLGMLAKVVDMVYVTVRKPNDG